MTLQAGSSNTASSDISESSISIRLRSFDRKTLDSFAQGVVERVVKTGAAVSGPMPMRSRKRAYAVNRSPFVDKRSMEHFALQQYSRVIILRNTNARTVEVLAGLELPAGIEVIVKS